MTDEFFETYEKAINVARRRFGLNFRALRVVHWEKIGFAYARCEASIELGDYPEKVKVSDITAGIVSPDSISDPVTVLESLIEKLEKGEPK